MKQISTALKSHISGELTSMVTCWQLTRRDGLRMGFTTHDQEIDFENLIYQPVNSFQPTSVSSSNGLNVDNMEVSAFLSADGLNAKDIRNGLFDHATISIFQLNWQEISQGKLHIRSGWLGEFTLKDNHFTVEIRGLTQKLQQVIGNVYSPECRADLGGVECHVNLQKYNSTGKATASTSLDQFEDTARAEAAGWFDYGMVRWLTGKNAGIQKEVKHFTAGRFILYDPVPEPIEIGDIYLAIAGCDKRSVTCKNKFQNFKNFRGEVAIPGTDSLYNYPGFKG